ARHLQFHGYFRINWWVDLILLLRRNDATLDWDLVAREAARHGVSGGLERTLEMVTAIYGLKTRSLLSPRSWSTRPTRALHRRIWPTELAVPSLRPSPEQQGTPVAPRFLSPGGVHPVA